MPSTGRKGSKRGSGKKTDFVAEKKDGARAHGETILLFFFFFFSLLLSPLSLSLSLCVCVSLLSSLLSLLSSPSLFPLSSLSLPSLFPLLSPLFLLLS